ncbi:MAG: glycine cleavage system aminomethyltransferase GcvT [Terriglobia bacterium]
MASSPGVVLKRTALYDSHRAAGARMVEFGGWEMPVEYPTGILEEHVAVRTRAGLFDVSHMGEIEVRGPKALEFLQHVTCNDVARLQIFQAQYSALMESTGCAVDDCVIHRLGEAHFFICVNASNTDKDFEYLLRRNSASEVVIENVSASYSQLALQGPASAAILSRVCDSDSSTLRTYWCRPSRCCGVEGLLARTGYTGEDGFEFYFPPEQSARVWNTLLQAGRGEGLIPAGLGARNTLRLEAAYPLYGHELDGSTTLLEANLGWICKLEKGPFLGCDALATQKREGLTKKLIGIEMTGRGIAREDYPLSIDGRAQGRVTSGSYAPYLKKNIGMAFVPPAFAEAGREMQVEIRGKLVPARQVALPFYKRNKISGQ